jgi:hypothetical protein
MVNLSLSTATAMHRASAMSRWPILGTDFGDYSTALRFAQLSLDLVEKRGLDAFKARVYLRYGGHQPLDAPLSIGPVVYSTSSR